MVNFRGPQHACLLLLALLTLLPIRLLAGEPSPGMKLEGTEPSPLGDILVKHYFRSDDYKREVWLVSASRPADQMLLYVHGRSVEVLFSPDERWLIINNFSSSTETNPYLFQRVQGLRYTPVENAKIGEKVWQLVGKQYPVVLSRDFGHRYVQVMRWAYDSKSFLVVAFGHLDSIEKQSALDPWYCVFTVDGLRASLDLAFMNRGALSSRSLEVAPSGPWK